MTDSSPIPQLEENKQLARRIPEGNLDLFDELYLRTLSNAMRGELTTAERRATWHRNYTPLALWIRAHILKQAMGWNGETQLAKHFEGHPELAMAYGFVDDDPMKSETCRPVPPTQSRLWEMRHEEFSDDLRDTLSERTPHILPTNIRKTRPVVVQRARTGRSRAYTRGSHRRRVYIHIVTCL